MTTNDNQRDGKILESTDKLSIERELKTSFLDYAMSVIVSRALPDVRDGLKPVHRRILYAMHKLGYYHDKSYRKSATVVGEVIGHYIHTETRLFINQWLDWFKHSQAIPSARWARKLGIDRRRRCSCNAIHRG